MFKNEVCKCSVLGNTTHTELFLLLDSQWACFIWRCGSCPSCVFCCSSEERVRVDDLSGRMKPKRCDSSQTELRNTAHTGLQSDCNQTLLCQDVTSPSQPCHEGPPTWTHAPVRARSSPPFTPPAAPSSHGVQPGQGLSLNRRHLPVVSIAQLSVISHYFLNLFSAHEAQQVEGKASQPCSPEHHTTMLFICKRLFAWFTFHC